MTNNLTDKIFDDTYLGPLGLGRIAIYAIWCF